MKKKLIIFIALGIIFAISGAVFFAIALVTSNPAIRVVSVIMGILSIGAIFGLIPAYVEETPRTKPSCIICGKQPCYRYNIIYNKYVCSEDCERELIRYYEKKGGKFHDIWN